MPGSTASGGPTKQLKILMTADAVGGVWQYCIDLITELGDRGAEVMLATMGPRPTAVQRQEVLAIPGVTLSKATTPSNGCPIRGTMSTLQANGSSTCNPLSMQT